MKKPRVTTMNVSLPVPLRERLDQKVRRLDAYGSTSDYVRDLIRRDLQRDQLAALDELITEGADSGASIPVTPEWWEERRARAARHHRERSKKPQPKRA
jgi:antitoxin ParD1/3/4